MDELLSLLPVDERLLGAVSRESLVGLHSMLSWHGSPELRHLAFAALMRLGRQAPTLFRKDDDPAQDATAGTCCLSSRQRRSGFRSVWWMIPRKSYVAHHTQAPTLLCSALHERGHRLPEAAAGSFRCCRLD